MPDAWPPLPYRDWADTRATLHLWTQIVGKIRMAHAAPINHWWHVPLYVSCCGLTTSPIPYRGRLFEIEFDFLGHRLVIATNEGKAETIPLAPRTVADFYREVMGRLRALDLETRIWTMPCELPDPIPFEADHAHSAYDPAAVERFWRVLAQSDRVLTAFRGSFLGKASPVHFFWGSFDMAVTRFSGRRAPPHPGAPHVADKVTREAYSHEVSSCGFWPGGPGLEQPIFYSYAYPQPAGFENWAAEPAGAFWSRDFGEFILPYDNVRNADDPDAALSEFLRTTYDGAAMLGRWDRAGLERKP